MTFENRLLAGLPPAEQALLAPHLTRLSLPRGRTIHDPERPIEAVYFPIDSIISILSVMADRTAIETATRAVLLAWDPLLLPRLDIGKIAVDVVPPDRLR